MRRALHPDKPGLAAAKGTHAARDREDDSVHRLQQAGNQAMQSALRASGIQRKGVISTPADAEEREADETADHVVEGCSCKSGGWCKTCKGNLPDIQRKAAGAVPSDVSLNAIRGALQAGRPLDAGMRAFFEPRFGRDFSQVRIHDNSAVHGAARKISARAFTAGSDIAFAKGEYSPGTREGRKLLAHELTHVAQQHPETKSEEGMAREAMPQTDATPPFVSQPNDGSEHEAARIAQAVADGSEAGTIRESPSAKIQRDLVCDVPDALVGTFVLDPAISGVPIPTGMSVHLRIASPMAGGGFSDRIVDLERPVTAAARLTAYAIPLDRLALLECTDEQATRTFVAGEQAQAPSGLVTITFISGDIAFIEEPNPDIVGAAAVIYAETNSGIVVIDAGLKVTDPQYKQALGEELARQIKVRTHDQAIDEAVLAPAGPDGPSIPYIAETVGIRAIRSTRDLYDNGSVSSVLAAQQRYRQWYQDSVRDRLIAQRADWEGAQPIAPNQGIRDQIWEAHLQQAMSAAMHEPPPALAVAGESAGILHAGGDLTPSVSNIEPGQIPDLTATKWKPVDDQYVFIYGGGQLAMFSSKGLVMEPVGEPLPTTETVPAPTAVPDLLPSGPLGMAEVAPRPVTPWMLVSAIGKESHVIVRTSEGLALLVDAGGPKRITLDAFTNASARLGGVTVESLLITHPHKDHIKYLLELIEAHNIKPEDLVLSEYWPEVADKLWETTHDPLLKLGYGRDWIGPRIAMETGPVTQTTIRSGSLDVDIIALSSAHRDYAASKTGVAVGGSQPKKMTSEMGDRASLLYIYGNESSSNRTLFLGDFRGDNILDLRDAMGAERFGAALRNVRTIVGAGHHFSHAAGQDVTDVEGLNLLVETALKQNGELTIIVQSSTKFAFEGPITAQGPEGALLRYFKRQGVRVVFAGENEGDVVIDSAGHATVHGPGIAVFDGDPRVVQAQERLQVLREARRTVGEKSGAAALQLEGDQAELEARLDADITRLEGLLHELQVHVAADLVDARGPSTQEGRRPARVRERQAYRAANTTPGRDADQILNDIAAEGPAEQSLKSSVRQQLRRSIASGRSVAIEFEFANVPTEVLEAVPDGPQRQALAKEYGELSEIAAKVEGGMVEPSQREKVFLRAKALRDALLHAFPPDGPAAAPTAVKDELARITSIVDRLEVGSVKEVTIGHDVEGRQTRTEYIRLAKQNELVMRGFHEAGRVMGALMVIHSVSEVGAILDEAARDKLTIPEGILRVAHSAWGLDMGVRMVSTTFRQAAEGTGAHVAPWEFTVMAVLEVGAAAVSDYRTEDERRAALFGAAVHGGVNLLCMNAGMAVMEVGAEIPFPLAKLAVMGLGLAITMAGEKILGALGLDETVRRWSDFRPDEVFDIAEHIDEALHEYRILIGAQQIAGRSDDDIRNLGLGDPAEVRKLAASVGPENESDLRRKETNLTYLFGLAYGRTKSAWVGLQTLDEQAAEFTRLRNLAMAGSPDPNRANLDPAWRGMDSGLDLNNAGETTIRDMEQWTHIRNKIYEVDGEIRGGVNFHKVFESMEELQMIMDNARYRVDAPTRRAGTNVLRPVAMIAPESSAYPIYMELLTAYERQLAGLHERLLQAGEDTYGGSRYGYRYEPSMDLEAALSRLHSARTAYDVQVEATAAENPDLALSSTWKDPAKLATIAVAAYRKDEGLFNYLHLREQVLESAARQTEFVLNTASPAPGESVRQIVLGEISGANDAILARRETHGLVFPQELDTVLVERGAQTDALLAVQIDAAHPRAGTASGTSVQPPTPMEFEALSADPLSSVGENTTTTEHQLARARLEMAPARVVPLDEPLPSLSDYIHGRAPDIWNEMGRAITIRQFAVLKPSYEIYLTGYWHLRAYESHDVEPGRTPIVCILPDSKMILSRGLYTKVIAVNADAVAELGPDPKFILGLTGISNEELTRRQGAPKQ